jgi:hypothetical protein
MMILCAIAVRIWVRKPVVVGVCLISLLTPLSGLYFYGPVMMLAAKVHRKEAA